MFPIFFMKEDDASIGNNLYIHIYSNLFEISSCIHIENF